MIEHRYFFSAFCPLSAFRDHTFVLSFLVLSLGTDISKPVDNMKEFTESLKITK